MVRVTRKHVMIASLLTALILVLVVSIAEYAKFPLTARVNGMETQPLALVFVVLVIIAVVAAGIRKRDWGSYDHPPSMKQLA